MDWSNVITKEESKVYMQQLYAFLDKEYTTKLVYPKEDDVFKAFELTPLDDVKIVIVGQDPYHGENQATGLAFAVPKTMWPKPPSLNNVWNVVLNDYDIDYDVMPDPYPFLNSDLIGWAKQGVLLLNTTLTVECGKPGSHFGKGWETFTDKIIGVLSGKGDIIFMLWGKYAQSKEHLIDVSKNKVLKTSHPSPFSVNRGFNGCGHFYKTRHIIDWSKT